MWIHSMYTHTYVCVCVCVCVFLAWAHRGLMGSFAKMDHQPQETETDTDKATDHFD
jgi:hypothetical protein